MKGVGNADGLITLRTGIDLVEISRLEGLRSEIRRRFIERVFTPREIADVGGSDEGLMGRFAAKEAIAKALGSGIGKVAWRDIEIWENDDGAPLVCLHGEAQALAECLKINQWSLSISHSRSHVVAIAVALGVEATEGK